MSGDGRGSPEARTLASLVDHTALGPETTPAAVERLCSEAVEHGFAAVCVNPVHVPRAASELAGSGVAVATVLAFPLGARAPAQKAREAVEALEMGARELDMVADLAALREDRWDALSEEVRAVAEAAAGRALLKVILETAILEPRQILKAARVAAAAGADFVKTSTGFHSAGGATAEAVALLRMGAGPDVGVKASGGIRTCEAALRMVASGATRIGTSSGLVLAGCTGPLPEPLGRYLGPGAPAAGEGC